MSQIRATSMIRAIVMSFNQLLNRMAVFLCILTYVVTGNPLNAAYAYTITSFHAVLRNTVTKIFPKAITQLAETKVSAKRIEHFLGYEEIGENIQIPLSLTNGGTKSTVEKPKQIGIHLRNAYVRWLPSLPDWNLTQVTFDARSSQTVAVVGPVGGGKTTLLHTILKELPVKEGSIEVEGQISYASQEPWVFGGSVRQNILFGQKYDELKYKEVLRVCALERDLTLFPHGDRTLVGERGVTLSGGQRARINLARAVYKDTDIYLLDDPLSAVDTHVGKQLFDDCISSYLGDKCVVLVTHQLQYLKDVNRIYLLDKDGKVETSGSYREMKTSGGQFTKLLADCEEEERKAEEEFRRKSELAEENGTDDFKKETPKLEKEQRAIGSIEWRVYNKYFSAGGSVFETILLFVGFVVAQFLASAVDYFVSIW